MYPNPMWTETTYYDRDNRKIYFYSFISFLFVFFTYTNTKINMHMKYTLKPKKEVLFWGNRVDSTKPVVPRSMWIKMVSNFIDVVGTFLLFP